ncbi:helix-turn-helix transcriptional regulator [Sorangium sp. So ce118]
MKATPSMGGGARAAPGAPGAQHAAAVGLSERQLRRRFLVAVGLTPKTYARIVRLHHAMAWARASVVPDWTEVAVRSGFYDQPHMLAAFRRAVGVCGTAPGPRRRCCSGASARAKPPRNGAAVRP